MNPRISVILPVFNARSFLPFTLRNIIEDQFATMSPHEWELIVVDDGSSDGSHLEVTPWIERFPDSVHLIRKHNAGVSAARNSGLATACGRYIYFIDADDILLGNSLPQLTALAEKSNVDMMKFMFRQISPEEYLRLSVKTPEAPVIESEVFSTSAYLEHTKGMTSPEIHSSTWQTLYRRQMLIDNNVSYNESLRIGEDEHFTWSAIAHAHTIGFTPARLYLYHQRPGSASHALDPEKELKYQFERIRFCGEMIETIKHVEPLMSADIARTVNRNYFLGFQHSVIDLVVKNFPFPTIRRAMKLYRSYGGDVHPGRPRFTPFYNKQEQPLAIKLRRMVAAYIIPLFI